MAKTCPQCQRPNSDQAAKCIYCGGPFPEPVLSPTPASAPSAEPKAKPGPSQPELPEAFLVVLSPVEGADPKWQKPFCDLTGFDRYLAKQRFKSVAPWVVRVFKDQEPAQQFLAKLAELGLDAYLLKQSGIGKLEAKLVARGLRFAADGIVFLTAAGEEAAVRYADLFLIVRGRIQVQPEREDPEENPVEVSIGGLIVGARGETEENPEDALVKLKQQVRRIKVRPKERHQRMFYRGQESLLMDLYLKGSHVGIRVMETEFDFSGMGERKLASAMLNFNAIFRDLIEHAPAARVDDYFNRISYVMEEVSEKDRVRSALQEIGVSSSARKLFDNKAFFTDYSSRIYLHYLRGAKSAKPASSS